jgi:hypothetical protein
VAPPAVVDGQGAGQDVSATISNSSAPSLSVQVVLYRHGVPEVMRLVGSLRRTIAVARQRQDVSGATVLIGDSSPQPVLDLQQVIALQEHLSPGGEVLLDYQFFGRNRGSAGGNNDLFGSDGGELVLIVNPDCYASPTFLAELCEGLRDPGVGVADGRQVPLEHPKDFDRTTGDCSWASGACMMVRRSVIDRIGGFDEGSFFMYCDDVDFSWRARLSGYRVVYRPTACVFHDKRLDPGGQIEAGEAEVYYSAEAALMMAWKYSRPDLVEEWSTGLLRTELPQHRKAVETFNDRRAEGRLPQPLDPEGHVAQFVGYNYARHRFLYDD